jgi:membrane dipeptidase
MSVRFCLVTAAVLCLVAGAASRQRSARDLHFDAIVVDTHNDVAQRMISGEDISVLTATGHSDLPRLREGGVDVEIFSIWVPPEKTRRSYYDQADEQIDSVESLAKRNPAGVLLARSSADIEKAVREHKLAAMMGMEGGHPLLDSIGNLDHFYGRGVRYMTLTWNNSTSWATSAKDETDPETTLAHKGLTEVGRAIVRKMNEMGMLVDVSHVGEQTFWDVIRTTTKPVIASHSSVWNLCPHRRNLKDDQLRAIAKNGGVVFINFNPGFIDSTFSAKEEKMRAPHQREIDSLMKALPGDEFMKENRIARRFAAEYLPIRPPLSLLVDHFDYVAKLVGADHVGIGSDFDGISVTPLGMDDVAALPNVTRELLKRGYSESDVRKMLGGNFLRVLKEAERR